MEAAGSPETLVTLYKTTQRHIPDDTSIHSLSHVNVKSHSSALKMEAVSSSETLITMYKITQRHIPDDTSIHILSHVNLKSHSSALKMEAISSFETLVTIYRTTQIPDDTSTLSSSRENLKSRERTNVWIFGTLPTNPSGYVDVKQDDVLAAKKLILPRDGRIFSSVAELFFSIKTITCHTIQQTRRSIFPMSRTYEFNLKM
jgi:hypothetical protein